jgi:hypothetical protein
MHARQHDRTQQLTPAIATTAQSHKELSLCLRAVDKQSPIDIRARAKGSPTRSTNRASLVCKTVAKCVDMAAPHRSTRDPEEVESASPIELGLVMSTTAASPAVISFPRITLNTVHKLQDIAQIKSDPSIQCLVQLFESDGTTVRVGCNIGTGELSLCLVFANHQCDRTRDTLLSTHVIQLMLGIHTNQVELETAYQLGVWKDGDHHTLAARCLDCFAQQTGVGIVDRRLNIRCQTLKITIGATTKGMKQRVDGLRLTDKKQPLFDFHRGYHHLLGIGLSEMCTGYTIDIQQQQHMRFTQKLLADFWAEMAQRHYQSSPILRCEVSKVLEKYLHGAVDVQGLSAGFKPQRSLRLFLHGSAGVGKSAFTQTFAACLERVLQTHIDPRRRVDIVKCPLNSVSPANLSSMLRVQGISDWSLERILEQTVRRGDIAVLHLEELPEQHTLQEELFNLLDSMAKELVEKYPGSRHNIVFIGTSNYTAAPVLATKSTVVEMLALDKDVQREWCTAMLQHTIADTIGLNITKCCINVELSTLPPCNVDMRPLEAWYRCLAYHISRRLLVSGESLYRHVRITIGIRETFSASVGIRVEVIASIKSDCHGAHHTTDHNREVFLLESQNQVLFYEVAPQFIASRHWLETFDFPSHYDSAIDTTIGMLVDEYLMPAVFVIKGGNTSLQIATSNCLCRGIRTRCHGNVEERQVSILSAKDKTEIFGSPSDVRGGLFKFIDDITNPNAPPPECKRFAVVVAVANEQGQYIMRELLEGNTSRTHRHHCRKHRTAFIVIVPPGASVQPETLSRAHVVIDVDDA